MPALFEFVEFETLDAKIIAAFQPVAM